MDWDAIIIGGGIAGCSTAIDLARRGRSVLLLEQSRYPSAKLCGEFLSIEASSYLQRLGVLEQVRCAGAVAITQTRMTSRSGAVMTAALPGVALGLSRSALDHLLFERAKESGAEGRAGVHVRGIAGSLDDGFTVQTSTGEEYRGRCVIGAYGKRSALDTKALGRPDRHSPFLAFKGHYRGVHAPDTVEVFGFDGGYVGFSPVEEGLVNACFISHRGALERAGGRADAFVADACLENPRLADRMACLTQVGKLIGCSNISFRIKGTFEQDVCMVGDSAGMIAPLCGDGMSMAMRGAEMAAICTDRFLAGSAASSVFRREYTLAWRREFLVRLTVGRILQQVSTIPAASEAAVRLCNAIPAVRNLLMLSTRGKPVHAETG